MFRAWSALLLLLPLPFFWSGPKEPLPQLPKHLPQKGGFLGSQSCRPCHEEIYQRQRESNMARTWRSAADPVFAGGYDKTREEGPPPLLRYRLARRQDHLVYEISREGEEKLSLPVEAVTGGPRFGIGFLVRLQEVGGRPLPRAALVETRYRHDSQRGELGLTAGHRPHKPSTLDTQLGRVLSPAFETRCLTCHRSPQHSPSGEAGVGCEDCHGPGAPHLQAVAEARSELAVANPGKMAPSRSIEVCAQCHASSDGVGADPRPEDLLISNQATSLRLSECFIQSGGQLSCLSCHDPHQNAHHDWQRYDTVCLSCHAPSLQSAASCLVNPQQGCVGCHMPQRRDGTMVDHWIRVEPRPDARPSPPHPNRTRHPLKRLFLRMLVVRQKSMAESLRAQLLQGASFHQLALEHSQDPSAADGGFLGSLQVDQLNPVLAEAATRLGPGELSPVLSLGREFILLQRLPRDFRWRSNLLEEQGTRLKASGQIPQALAAYQLALEENPHNLRALLSSGTTWREQGDMARALAFLEKAVRLYPQDAQAHYELGLTYGLAGRLQEELRMQRRAMELNPDNVAPYLRAGVILFRQRRWQEAARAFEEALQVNPLVASAYYNLAQTQYQLGDPQKAQATFALAVAIDPSYADKPSPFSAAHFPRRQP